MWGIHEATDDVLDTLILVRETGQYGKYCGISNVEIVKMEEDLNNYVFYIKLVFKEPIHVPDGIGIALKKEITFKRSYKKKLEIYADLGEDD